MSAGSRARAAPPRRPRAAHSRCAAERGSGAPAPAWLMAAECRAGAGGGRASGAMVGACRPHGPSSPSPSGARRATRCTPTRRSWASSRSCWRPPEPALAHAALRLTARGWETNPLPAPDGSGALVVALDLHAHEARVEHSDGRVARVPLAPGQAGRLRHEGAAGAGGRARRPRRDQPGSRRRCPWTAPLDEDEEHARYDTAAVELLHAVRDGRRRSSWPISARPIPGRRTPVNAWWGSFDLVGPAVRSRPRRRRGRGGGGLVAGGPAP